MTRISQNPCHVLSGVGVAIVIEWEVWLHSNNGANQQGKVQLLCTAISPQQMVQN